MKKGIIIMMTFLFTVMIFGQKIIPFKELVNPKTITVTDKQIFITENTRVLIFSIKDYKLQTAFGKSGEGPGEFKIATGAEIGIGVQISVQPDYILVNSIGRFSYFSHEGKFIQEKSTGTGRGPYGHNYTPAGSGFIAYGFSFGQQGAYVTINMYNKNLKKEKELHRHLFFVQRGKKTNLEVWRPSLFYVSKGRIIIDREDSLIDIFNFGGKKIRTLTKKYPRVKVTSARKSRYLNFLKTDPRFKDQYMQIKQTSYFPEYLPLIRTYTVDDKRIYVLTNLKRQGKSQFYVLDYKGNLLKKAWVLLREKTPIEPYPFAIRDGIIYQLNDNQDTEEWEIVMDSLIL